LASFDRAHIARVLAKAERSNPGDAIQWFSLGAAYWDLQMFDRAISCYGTSLGLDPNQAWAFFMRGQSRLALGDYGPAIEDFDDALRLRPGWDEVLINRAWTYEKTGKSAKAIADLTAVLRNSPEKVDLLARRARLRDLSGDRQGADADRKALLSTEPKTVNGWVARAVLQQQTDPKAALADLDAALELDPHSLEALHLKADLLSERLKKPEDAIRVFNRAIQLYPETGAIRSSRGVLLARLGRRDEALDDARAVLALRPSQRIELQSTPLVVYQTAGIFALSSATNPDDRREALRLLADALRRDPTLLDYVSSDPELAPLRNDPDFVRLIAAAWLLRGQ
jgi:tetratricopeptide (TPR) repeat protein